MCGKEQAEHSEQDSAETDSRHGVRAATQSFIGNNTSNPAEPKAPPTCTSDMLHGHQPKLRRLHILFLILMSSLYTKEYRDLHSDLEFLSVFWCSHDS